MWIDLHVGMGLEQQERETEYIRSCLGNLEIGSTTEHHYITAMRRYFVKQHLHCVAYAYAGLTVWTSVGVIPAPICYYFLVIFTLPLSVTSSFLVRRFCFQMLRGCRDCRGPVVGRLMFARQAHRMV